MNNHADILQVFIDEDFGLDTRDDSNWGKSIDHDSLVLDKNKGIFFWNSRGIVGDPLVYLTDVRGMEFYEAKHLLENFKYSGTHVYTINANNKGRDIVVYPRLVDVFFELGQTKRRRDYLYRRGLTDETINRFRIGWYNDFNTVPFFEGGTFRNFQIRKDIPTKIIKSYYGGIGPLLFNSDIMSIVNTIYYTEGPIDAIALAQVGLPAISTNCGGGYSLEWITKFTKQDKIYIVFDNDSAGVKESKKLARVFGEGRCRIYTFDGYEIGYDPVDYFLEKHSKEEFVKLVEENSKYIFELG